MKHLFTFLTIALFTVKANAQFSENFEGTLASCWSNVNTISIAANKGINQKSLGFTNNGNATMATPYLDVITGSVTISFKYALTGNLQAGKTRTIELGYQDKNGTFTSLSGVIPVTSTASTNYSITSAVTDNAYRIVIKSTADGGNDNAMVDDLTVNAAYHYGASPCNTAPVSTNASFGTVGAIPYSGNLTSYATDANGEAVTFAVVAAPTASGTLVLNANGTFTFTPTGGFIGGPVTFTYAVTDNGYDPMTSNTATVTINYPDQAPLPVYITSFAGSINNSKVQLTWSVGQNEDGDQFQVEKSNDGRSFTTAGVVMNTNKQGAESYSYIDANFNGTTYYRLKIVNKSGSISYSRTIVLKDGESKANNLVITQNPVASSLNFNYTANAAGSYIINLYNAAGIKVYTSQITMQKGFNVSSISVDSRIVPGAYIVEISNNAERSVAKIVKQ
jgi:hypothetical protein